MKVWEYQLTTNTGPSKSTPSHPNVLRQQQNVQYARRRRPYELVSETDLLMRFLSVEIQRRERNGHLHRTCQRRMWYG